MFVVCVCVGGGGVVTLCGSEWDVVDTDFIRLVGTFVGEGISIDFVDLFFFLCVFQLCAFLRFPFRK
jgi:hypothetical protein